jgi:hypothetical protein
MQVRRWQRVPLCVDSLHRWQWTLHSNDVRGALNRNRGGIAVYCTAPIFSGRQPDEAYGKKAFEVVQTSNSRLE